MRNKDYNSIACRIDPLYIVHREDDFIYFLYPNPPMNGNILLQEKGGITVLWSIEYKEKPIKETMELLCDAIDEDVVVPFIETEEEYNAVISLGGVPIDFDEPCCEDLCRDYGSCIIRKQEKDEL